jgi:hypothetical protein
VTPRPSRRPRFAALLAVTVLAVTAVSCQTTAVGKRCSPSAGLARNATHVLICRDGRWQRLMTIADAGRVVAAKIAADQATQQPTTTTAAPTTTAPTTTTAAPTTTTSSTTTTTTVPSPTVSVLAAGDLANCDGTDDDKVAAIIRANPTMPFLALGDLNQGDDPDTEYPACYEPVFGDFRDRTYPAPGNHEYMNGSPPAAYLTFFGTRARPKGTTWYSYDLGAWHVVSLNANCTEPDVGGCGTSSAQYRWLAADLAASTTPCLMAYWHQAPFSSTVGHTGEPAVVPMLSLLQSKGLDVLLGGHLHNYERFARMDSSGAVDPTGFRAFVVGTGGFSHFAMGTPDVGSEARSASAFGVLKLDLASTGFSWKFLPASPSTYTDSGSDTC